MAVSWFAGERSCPHIPWRCYAMHVSSMHCVPWPATPACHLRCMVVSCRLYGTRVALKAADVSKRRDLVCGLRREVQIYGGTARGTRCVHGCLLVLRGGTWHCSMCVAWAMRYVHAWLQKPAICSGVLPATKHFGVGFRCLGQPVCAIHSCVCGTWL